MHDDTELLEIKKIHVFDLISMVVNGEIRDSISVAGIMKLQYMIQSKDKIIRDYFSVLLQ